MGDGWYVDVLCNRFRFFCRDYGNIGKMRNPGNGFRRCDSNQDNRSVAVFVAYGSDYRDMDGNHRNRWKNFAVPCFVRFGNGASWLCYFHALQQGDINKVVPIDKSSTVLTILLALIFLHEGLTWGKAVSILFIGAGTLLMVSKKESNAEKEQQTGVWLVYAILSAVFASLTAILGKVGITGIDSNLGTAIRTMVVLIMAWLMVLVSGKWQEVKKIQKKELGFIVLSGLATGASWLCYYRALQGGPASVVVPIDKLSILVTIAFSWIVFHEKLTKKSALGVACITVGTVLLAVI